MYSKLKILFSMSDRTNILIISLLLVTCTFFSALIPPFQSPDEYDHIKRSYLLSKGTIILDRPQGKSSGGMIDSGLLAYMNAYRVTSDKLSSDTIDSADYIEWSGNKIFSPAPGTGFYFPLIYMPQATGLAIGEKLGLTIDSSYRLARLVTLVTVAAIIFSAFLVYPANPLVIALIVMPMSIFQFSSASLDGISTALSIFSIAAFLKIATDKEKARRWLFYALTTSVILLATSRVHLLPLLALVLIPCFYFKKKKYYVVFSFALLAVLAWLVIAIRTTVDLRVEIGVPTSSIILFYMHHPAAFIRVLLATLSDGNLITFYYQSFFGILGWLDTRFSSEIYDYLLTCFILVSLLSISIKSIKIDWAPRALLIALSFLSILLIFFALLVTWTPHPASIIAGIQGRYFLIPVIMLAYAISGDLKLYEGTFRKTALIFCIALFVFTISDTTKILLDRYYIAFEQPKIIPVSMHPSAPLDKKNSVKLAMSESYKNSLQPLKGISILFGTYARKNTGIAELSLTTLDGHTFTSRFDLSDLADNKYKHFELDPLSYSSGEILSLTGEGVSVWEAHEDKGLVATCFVYEYTNGSRRYTRGCPKT